MSDFKLLRKAGSILLNFCLHCVNGNLQVTENRLY